MQIKCKVYQKSRIIVCPVILSVALRYMWDDTKNLTGDLIAPGVEVWCMYGVGLPTAVTYVYDDGFPNADPVDFVYADGDDTVDSFSMGLCKRWAGQQDQPVHVTEFRGLTHLDMVFHDKVLRLVQDILEGKLDIPKEIDVRTRKVSKT